MCGARHRDPRAAPAVEGVKNALSNEASGTGRILRTFVAFTSSLLLGRLVGFVATAVLTRRLGPEGFGVIGFATALCGYFALAVNSGLHDAGMRHVARTPDRAVDVYSSVTTIRLVLAAGVFVVVAIVAAVLPKPPLTRLVVVLTGLSFFSFAIDPTWVLKGLERPALAGLGLVLGQAIYASGVVLLVAGPPDVARVPVVQFVGELVAAVAMAAWLMRHQRPRVKLAEGWAILKDARYLALSRFSRVVVISFDMVLLGFLATDRALGLYAAAYRFTFLLMAVAASVNSAYLPSFARVIRGTTADIRRLVESSLATVVSIGAPLVAGSVLTAGPLLVLLFGPEYEDAAPAFRLLALSIGVVFIHSLQANLFIAANRTRLLAAISTAAAILNIVLNLVLIPRYGIEGAGGATLLSELAVWVAGFPAMRRLGVLPSLRPALRPLAATLVMSVAVWLLAGVVPLIVRIGIGALVYGSALAAVGGIPRTLLRQVLTRNVSLR